MQRILASLLFIGASIVLNAQHREITVTDTDAMRANARSLLAAFAWNRGFREYFAVKATPNPYLIKLLVAEGFGMDCSSMAELLLAERLGVRGEDIMFTSNDTPAEEYAKARELGAIVNLDDITHIDFLARCAGLPACWPGCSS